MNPTEIIDLPWIISRNKKVSYPKHTKNSGKWLVFENSDNINDLWKLINEATINGELGGLSKVSTKMINITSKKLNQFVVCVYTYDFNDVNDRNRVRQRLKELGVVKKIPYKSDLSTKEGKYSIYGNNNLSICVE